MRRLAALAVGVLALAGCSKTYDTRDLTRHNYRAFTITASDGRRIPCVLFFESLPDDTGSASLSCDWTAR